VVSLDAFESVCMCVNTHIKDTHLYLRSFKMGALCSDKGILQYFFTVSALCVDAQTANLYCPTLS